MSVAVRAGGQAVDNMSGILADLLKVERVAPGAHFFDDLGADSMLLAQFCARVRKHPDLPSLSIKDVYAHPTIAGLAAAKASEPTVGPTKVSEPGDGPSSRHARPGTRRQILLCGALQLLLTVAYGYAVSLVLVRGLGWITGATTIPGAFVRSMVFGTAGFLATCLAPIAVKWVLIGRWRPQQITVWSLAYVRFWAVSTLIKLNPLVLFVGTPIYPLYLRALGARIGRDVAIFANFVPICTDLLTIGSGSTIRQKVYANCYRARDGVIEIGPVTIGRDCYIGETSVLDINTRIGDRAQLAHASALFAGQRILAGERRQGSPAEQCTRVDQIQVSPMRCSDLRKIIFSLCQLLKAIIVVPAGLCIMAAVLAAFPGLERLLDPNSWMVTEWSFYLRVMIVMLMIFIGGVVAFGIAILTVPRLLQRAITPGRTYPLFGVHHEIHNWITLLTNVRFFTHLFGDSSAIPHYLRLLGWDLSRIEQTGTNFGLHVEQENPYLTRIGTGTVVADGLLIGNADFSNTSFRVSETRIGAHNFIGNDIAYPSQGRTGDNCLLATKVMIPIDGPVRENVGLLGSPSFEIPRSVQRDSRFEFFGTGVQLRRRLLAKNKYNAVTMLLYLLMQFGYLYGTVLLSAVALELFAVLGALAFPLITVFGMVLGLLFFSLVERASSGFRRLTPKYCSIYHPYFWSHERYWKLMTQPAALNGTPLKGWGWRLLGVRVGKRLFDDGSVFVDKSLITIGDDCTLNAGSIIQPHSQEDGAFKADTVTLGSGCTIGVGALVHYGVTIGDHVDLAPDSFLMKGEEVPPNARWGGNPAREL
jgi:non-ribosomal peptide synthetase-like protein